MASPNASTHYEALGVEQDTTDKDIKKAYRKLVMKLHPDKDPSEGAAARFQLIQKAYDILSDAVKRRKYDDALASGGAHAEEDDDHNDGATELMLAAQKGDVKEVQKLIQLGARIDEIDHFDRTALMYAATASQSEVVSILLAAKASASDRDSEGLTPFLCAAGGKRRILELKQGTLACLTNLLTAKAEVNEMSLKGYTALSLACNASSVVVTNFLISRKADPDETSSHTLSPLCVAAHRGNTKILELLLTARADPNLAAEGDGETALMVAAGAGHVGAVNTLVAAGADAKAFMTDGGSALLAVVEEHTEGLISETAAASVVQRLIQLDADPIASTTDGRTPLKVAARNTAQTRRGAWLEDMLSTAAAKQRSQETSCWDCLAGFRIMFGGH
mmetsp:Transcript_26983/g.58736  ORF Transcript_26983/g.58736 Transcript_26983/m.58736 type:complete len:391 (-) Transcript_26983:194-1366(-)